MSCLHVSSCPGDFSDVSLSQDDDEWDDYRENKKDYTGLKIDNLVVKEEEKAEEEETEVRGGGEWEESSGFNYWRVSQSRKCLS